MGYNLWFRLYKNIFYQKRQLSNMIEKLNPLLMKRNQKLKRIEKSDTHQIL